VEGRVSTGEPFFGNSGLGVLVRGRQSHLLYSLSDAVKNAGTSQSVSEAAE